jgi:hypothetical protein
MGFVRDTGLCPIRHNTRIPNKPQDVPSLNVTKSPPLDVKSYAQFITLCSV